MASGSVFSGTLQTITNTKLEELSKQQITFKEQHSALLLAAKVETNPVKRLGIVIDGTKRCLGVKTAAPKDDQAGCVISGGTRNNQLETDLKNADRFLDQAHFDPSVSTDVLRYWEEKILHYVSTQATKLQCADLHGKLVTEWLSLEKSTTVDGDVEMSESLKELPSTKRLEARAEWMKLVFEPAALDRSALKAYLEALFVTDKKSVTSSLNNLRKKVANFEASLTSSLQFNNCTLHWIIKSLQASDSLSNEKREVLSDFLSNDIILSEIADVLNMRMEALDRWTWGDHVLVEQKRQVNGQFNIRMHEDILQTVFLHYLGVKWSVFFKAAFMALRKDPKTWQSNRLDVPKIDRMRRGFFLGDQGQQIRGNLNDKRSNTQYKHYFMNQLLDYDQQQIQHNEGEEEAEFTDFVEERSRIRTKQTTYMSAPVAKAPVAIMSATTVPLRAPQMSQKLKSNDMDMGFGLYDDDDPPESDDDGDELDKNPMEAKQGLLHLLATEIILNTRLNGELTCFRTVFKPWNTLLPHDTALTILDFFGVSRTWSNFFKTFLQAPLKFADEEKDTQPRLRRRGTPSSHALSDVFGEVVLFCLDFSVNQNTRGALLHRLFDEVWFWNKDYDKCASAWANIVEFAEVTGVEINYVKSGSVHVSQDGELGIDDRLPQGDIRWGFLYLNPSTGRFDIDRKIVDSHVEELRKQLQGKQKSVIEWILTWNTHVATFFSSNFGKGSNCFGREHIDTMLATHRHIQESVFDGGNVIQHLKQMIEDRFDVSGLPDGFFYFPIELGGLDLKSPFIDLLQIRNSVKENPYSFLDQYEELEKDDYVEAKRRFDRGDLEHIRWNTEKSDFFPKDAGNFFCMNEFTRYREEFASVGSADLLSVYVELLKKPEEEPISPSAQITQALQELRRQGNLRGITSSWYNMDAYWKWVTQMYGPDVIARFGGLNLVDPGWLPIGMVGHFRQNKNKLKG